MTTPEQRTRLLILLALILAVLALIVILFLQSGDKGVPMAPGPLPIDPSSSSSPTVVV